MDLRGCLGRGELGIAGPVLRLAAGDLAELTLAPDVLAAELGTLTDADLETAGWVMEELEGVEVTETEDDREFMFGRADGETG